MQPCIIIHAAPTLLMSFDLQFQVFEVWNVKDKAQSDAFSCKRFPRAPQPPHYDRGLPPKPTHQRASTQKNGAKLGINADKAQLFIRILSQARKNPTQAVC